MCVAARLLGGEKEFYQVRKPTHEITLIIKVLFFLLTFCTQCYLQQNELSAAQTTEFN